MTLPYSRDLSFQVYRLLKEARAECKPRQRAKRCARFTLRPFEQAVSSFEPPRIDVNGLPPKAEVRRQLGGAGKQILQGGRCVSNKNWPFGTQLEYAVAHTFQDVEGLGKICAG